MSKYAHSNYKSILHIGVLSKKSTFIDGISWSYCAHTAGLLKYIKGRGRLEKVNGGKKQTYVTLSTIKKQNKNKLTSCLRQFLSTTQGTPTSKDMSLADSGSSGSMIEGVLDQGTLRRCNIGKMLNCSLTCECACVVGIWLHNRCSRSPVVVD